MNSIKHSYPIRKYQSTTFKVTSRHPLSINTNNYTAVKHQGFTNYTANKNYTLGNKSIIDSLNLSVTKNNYIYVDQMPNSNVIYYDSNLRKYRTFSATIKNQSYDTKTFNLANKQNLFKSKFNGKYTINNQYNQNNKYSNKTINYANIHHKTNKYLNINKNQSQRENHIKTYSIKTSGVNNNYNKTNIVNKYQTSSRNDSQNKRYNSYNNRTEQNKNNKSYNQSNNNRNDNKIINNNINNKNNINNINNNNQINQGRRRGEESDKKLILNSIQKNEEKNKNPINNNIPYPYQKNNPSLICLSLRQLSFSDSWLPYKPTPPREH